MGKGGCGGPVICEQQWAVSPSHTVPPPHAQQVFELVPGPDVGGSEEFQVCRGSSSGDMGESEGAGEGGGGTKFDSGSPFVKDSRHMLSKNRAASTRDSPLLRLRVGPREPLAGDFSTQVAPTPDGSRKVLTSCWGLASGDSRNLEGQDGQSSGRGGR